ncbi:MAG: YdcF family protein, partial [Pleurocapsa sp.]
DREEFTAQLARSHPTLPIWVSTGSPPQMTREIFKQAGILDREFYLDRRATDTVTNFTTLVADFKTRNFQHIYLITSDFHMLRAKAIAFVVLGSQGITITPLSVPSKQSSEPKIKIVRDVARAFLWIFTKRTGSSLNNLDFQ